MKALWASVSAIAVLTYAGTTVAAPSVGVAPVPAGAHVVTVELADANQIPVGDLYVSLANPVTARSFAYHDETTSIVGHALSTPPAALTLSTNAQVALADVVVTRNIAPGIATDFAFGETGLADPYNLRTNGAGGLFLSDSALGAPYASLANGGNYSGVRIQLGDQLRLRFGIASRDNLNFSPQTALSLLPAEVFASLGNGFRAQTASASIDWQFAEWGGIAVTATQANERGTVLGRTMAGPVTVSNGANTAALGVSARVGFGDGWVTTVALNAGVTHLDLKPGAFADDVRSGSYGVALTKEDIFGNDMFGFSVSRPLQSNGVVFGPDAFGPRDRMPLTALTSGNRGAQESDMQMGYVTTFLDGALALQANAGYQMNANGQKGDNAVSATAHAQFKF